MQLRHRGLQSVAMHFEKHDHLFDDVLNKAPPTVAGAIAAQSGKTATQISEEQNKEGLVSLGSLFRSCSNMTNYRMRLKMKGFL